MVVGHQRERPAALARPGVEHDRAGLGDRDRAAGDDAVDRVELGHGQRRLVVTTSGPRPASQAGGRPGGTSRRATPRRATAAAIRSASAPSPAERATTGPSPGSRPTRSTNRSRSAAPAGPAAGGARIIARRRRRPAGPRAPAGSGPGSPRGRSPLRSPRLGPPVAERLRPAAAGRSRATSRPTAAAAATRSSGHGARPGQPPGPQRPGPPARRRPSSRPPRPSRPLRRRHRCSARLASTTRAAGGPASSGCRSPPGRRRSRRRTATTRTAGVGFSPADPGQLRRQDRADRARVDRPVRVPAGPLVDRADVQAGRAADAAQRRPPGRVGERRRPAVVQQHQVELLRPRPPPVHIDVYGFIRSPVDERGSSCRNTSRSRQVGTSFSMPITVISVSRQGQAHPPVALGLDHRQRAGLGDREVGAGDRDLARRGTSAAGAGGRPRPARAGSSVSRRRRHPPAISRRKISRISARLRWIAGTRMCDGVSWPSCTISSARSVSPGGDAGRRQRLVEPDLLGRHRLDLDHLVGAGRPDQVGDDPRWPRPRPGPSAPSRRAR